MKKGAVFRRGEGAYERRAAGETDMAKGEQRSNREKKKPKKEKIKISAAAPSQKTGGWQPNLGSDKKK